MTPIIDFLTDYYVYVVGIGLILIIILIGFLASKNKGGKKEGKEQADNMVNLNDVKTGEINEVAANLKQNEMKPVDVAAMPTGDALVVDKEPVIPVSSEPTPVKPIEEPIVEDFDKTEIIDFQDMNTPKGAEEHFSFGPDSGVDNDNILNGDVGEQNNNNNNL